MPEVGHTQILVGLLNEEMHGMSTAQRRERIAHERQWRGAAVAEYHAMQLKERVKAQVRAHVCGPSCCVRCIFYDYR